MDDRLAKALETARYKATLSQARKNLLLRYQNALLHSCNGGVFTVTQTLILYMRGEVSLGRDEVVLIDDKHNPIMIRDASNFLADIETAYHTANNQYFFEFEKLRKARTTKGVVGL